MSDARLGVPCAGCQEGMWPTTMCRQGDEAIHAPRCQDCVRRNRTCLPCRRWEVALPSVMCVRCGRSRHCEGCRVACASDMANLAVSFVPSHRSTTASPCTKSGVACPICRERWPDMRWAGCFKPGGSRALLFYACIRCATEWKHSDLSASFQSVEEAEEPWSADQWETNVRAGPNSPCWRSIPPLPPFLFSAFNYQDPGHRPPQLMNLTFVEQALIALAFTSVNVVRLYRQGGHTHCCGHVASFPQRSPQWADALPRNVWDCGILLVQDPQQRATHSALRANPQRLRGALDWLFGLDGDGLPNNEFYNEWLQAHPGGYQRGHLNGDQLCGDLSSMLPTVASDRQIVQEQGGPATGFDFGDHIQAQLLYSTATSQTTMASQTCGHRPRSYLRPSAMSR